MAKPEDSRKVIELTPADAEYWAMQDMQSQAVRLEEIAKAQPDPQPQSLVDFLNVQGMNYTLSRAVELICEGGLSSLIEAGDLLDKEVSELKLDNAED